MLNGNGCMRVEVFKGSDRIVCIAAVCGNVFASPNAGQVKKGIELVDNDQGCV